MSVFQRGYTVVSAIVKTTRHFYPTRTILSALSNSETHLEWIAFAVSGAYRFATFVPIDVTIAIFIRPLLAEWENIEVTR